MFFHVDASWNSQEAVNYIERLVDGLELDLFTDVVDWDNEGLTISFYWFSSIQCGLMQFKEPLGA